MEDIILIVDDVEMNRAILSEIFKDHFVILEAADGQEALALTAAHQADIAAVLLDLHMPNMDGLQYLQHIRAQGLLKDVPILIITADNNEALKLSTFDFGITDIIEKPFNAVFLHKRVEAQIELYRSTKSLKYINMRQEAELRRRAEEFADLNVKVISALAVAIEFRSGETGVHVRHIRDLTKLLLRRLRTRDVLNCGALSDEDIEEISYAAILHDIGKISIPDSILNKPGRLTADEFTVMKTHSQRGADLIDSIGIADNKILNYARDICLHHHERVDGKGYPEGLRNGEISVWSKVVGIADAYDALTQDRCYKQAFSKEKALAMILNGECGAFEPILLDAFLDIVSKLELQPQSCSALSAACRA